MEAKAEKALDAARAEAELNNSSTSSSLADKYSDNGGDVSVDNELAEMKRKLGL